jgi:chemotaxis protein histidine kinase CheA
VIIKTQSSSEFEISQTNELRILKIFNSDVSAQDITNELIQIQKSIIIERELEAEIRKKAPKYLLSLFLKIEEANNLLSTQNPSNKSNLTNLRKIFHNIRGSAGSYGYNNISNLSAEIEKNLDEALLGKDLKEPGLLAITKQIENIRLICENEKNN